MRLSLRGLAQDENILIARCAGEEGEDIKEAAPDVMEVGSVMEDVDVVESADAEIKEEAFFGHGG